MNNEFENSALTHFAYSLLEKLSKKGDGTSTKSNDNHISGKTGYGAPTPDSQNHKSCKHRHKHKHKHKKRKEKEKLEKQWTMKPREISVKKSGMPNDGSWELNEAMNTCKSIKATMKRRRSKTGDEVKGLALKARQFGNFIEEESDHSGS